MEEAKLLKLTLVTPPDYFNSEGAKISCFGSQEFQNEVKDVIYRIWPDQEITLYACVYNQNFADWILHAASVSHFVLVEGSNERDFPAWLVEFVGDKPRCYVGNDDHINHRMLKRKDPRLVAESVEEAVQAAIKTLT